MPDVSRILVCCVLAGALWASAAARAMDLGASGAWSDTVDASDLIAGAGSELQDSHSSGSGAVALEVSNTAGSSDAWRVDIRRTDSVWDAAVTLWVRRTDDGTGDGSITGGAAWQAVGSTDAAFFSGEGDRASISVQVRVTGVSLSLSPDSYLSTIQYTLVDTL